MATSTDELKFVYNGRKLSYDRYRYELAMHNQAVLEQVNLIAMDQAAKVVGVAEALSQQEMGGFLRKTLPSLIDQYGNVNAVAAMNYYDEARMAWWMNHNNQATKLGKKRMADRYAGARLQGQIYVARLPKFDAAEKADGVVNYAMKLFADKGFQAMEQGVQNSLTRAVASYHHDTMLYNSALDESVYKVQRVADAKACAFCRMLAFKSGKTVYVRQGDALVADKQANLRTADYAIHFHDHCHCTIETLYQGDQPVRPEYYDQFEQQYIDAKGDLATMREQTGAR